MYGTHLLNLSSIPHVTDKFNVNTISVIITSFQPNLLDCYPYREDNEEEEDI